MQGRGGKGENVKARGIFYGLCMRACRQYRIRGRSKIGKTIPCAEAGRHSGRYGKAKRQRYTKAPLKNEAFRCSTVCRDVGTPTKYEIQLATSAPQAHTRKKVVATVNRREGVYNRAGEPSGLSCGRGGARERANVFL